MHTIAIIFREAQKNIFTFPSRQCYVCILLNNFCELLDKEEACTRLEES
jgi:hypothetical protein